MPSANATDFAAVSTEVAGEPQLEFDLVLDVELRRAQRRVVRLAADHFLRQRRPVVGQMRFPTGERQLTLVPGPSQFLGGSQA